ncbi:MAG: indolepyruvate oxidoreductase subunit beta [Candidatus Cloacimonetes bacterium]|jgi:indolepyruvate ferredoxin oxidoreductase beta subunit|nr:indolepyruvate oxidoreductase subunit beta [Candidatus Cloacimonadota bacterium]MDY0336985.1 indolepyruvate oxidoreductase subunit beta [Candidatus Cloacimonadaceae bacterium]MCB5270013.1 indolepyruvate oxidoreductase subunit beta [Candidatus Cloacimonadota bacterium]MCK9336080.1 indolepyruvate oxidoreductase subunit beta [Candidatus Cloacimonadota bacterium]MDD2542975.1 indolepyruvate oxidoreductase subunit beta [Candidatus Cloacimonadota bacterium]
MKKDIILAGVGGQGILTIATILGHAALSRGWQLKQAEVHGMSQRGGDVQSHLRLSDATIWSDLIPMGQADMIFSVEPMEALRYLPYLHSEGWIITNSTPFKNIPNYPDVEAVYAQIRATKNHLLFDADTIAIDINARRAMNIVVLGAAIAKLGFSNEEIEASIKAIFARKGENVVESNIAALRAGMQIK